jgi:site-specific DNA recombinase
MIAAIYARKSNEQDATEDNLSVVRQEALCRAAAAARAWQIAEGHVYQDRATSGAEFERRPGLVRLLNALKPRPSFDVLLVYDKDRIGREQFETAYILKQLSLAGVRVIECKGGGLGREIMLDTPVEKFLLAATGFAEELERDKARQRTADALLRKAQAGHVTGGIVFGYDNVDVRSPEGKRAHVERRVNEAEAAIVRRIFERYAAGAGFRTSAHELNAEAAPAPMPRR